VAQLWRVGALLLMALALAAGWGWHRAQAGLAQIEAELQRDVALELQAAGERPLTTTVHLLALTGETALVQLVIRPGPDQPAIRHTRVYRRSAWGWRRTTPEPAQWGPPRRLETDHFVFHYAAPDETAVTEAAAEADALYRVLSANWSFGLLTDAKVQEKVRVEVDPAYAPGSLPTINGDPDALIVASPAAYLAPFELGDADLLEQAIVLGLLNDLAAQARRRYQRLPQWHPLLNGMQLWQLWALDLPLAAWREPVVAWVIEDSRHSALEASAITPAFYAELCAAHQVWMRSPRQIHIPLVCTEPVWEEEGLRTWRNSYTPPPHSAGLTSNLQALEPYRGMNGSNQLLHPGDAVVMATVIEYAVAVYGQARLPVLVASLEGHTRWETLTQAVFGVSVAEFEAGWRAYLADRYR
jgi:hypothetical protein